MMQDYDITVAVGASRQLDAQGEYFYYNAGSAGGADPTIKLRGLSSGLTIKLKPGQGFRLPAGENETSWIITNFAGVSKIIGFVTVGNGEITDNRITGSVEVIDGGKNRTLSSIAFIGMQNTGTQTAGQYAHVQLWNPIGSGKNAVLEKINLAATSSSNIYLRKINTPLTTLGSTVDNKNLYGVQSISEMRYQTNSSILGSSYLNSFQIPPNQSYSYEFKEPLIISAGVGVLLVNSTIQTDIYSTFEFYEESAA